MLEELTLLRFLAILLITNSHFDEFYPIKLLGTGGSLGNSIFFFISAIGLTISLNKHKSSFKKWIKKRFLRIYPIVWFATTIFIWIGFLKINNLYSFFILYFWPTSFWFFSAIMLMYFPIYFLITRYTQKYILLTLSISILIYIFWYVVILDINSPVAIEEGYIHLIYSFIVMVFGVFIANNYKYIKSKHSYDVFIFFTITFVYFGLKLLILKLTLYNIQFLVHVLTIPWLFYLLRAVVHTRLASVLMKKYIINFIILTIASSSLEIYLLQTYIISLIVDFAIFPVNILLFTVVIIPVAYLLHFGYEKVIAYLTGVRYKI